MSAGENVVVSVGQRSLRLGDGDDTISVSVGGEHTLDGGGGDDRLIVDYSAVTSSAIFAVQISGLASTGYHGTLGTSVRGVGVDFSHIEHFDVTTGAGDDYLDFRAVATGVRLVSGEGADHVWGGAGADYIDAGSGADTITGGDGADTIMAGDGNDLIVAGYQTLEVHAGAGDDTVQAGPYAEVDLGTGANVLSLDRSLATAALHVDIAAGVFDVGGVTGEVAAVLAFTGGSGSDTLAGGDEANSFMGHGGRDLLYGGGGGDRLDGDGDGSRAADTLYGGAGGDTLIGGAGDVLYGGQGDDSFSIDDLGARIVEAAGEGRDTLETFFSAPAPYTLQVNVENLVIHGSTFIARGNALDNVIDARIAGGIGSLPGQATGAVTLHGGDGADTLYGSSGGDSLYGEGGSDVLYGGGGNDYVRTLTGTGPDTFYGGDGADLLTIERMDATQDLFIQVGSNIDCSVGEGSYYQSVEQIRFAGGFGNDSARGGQFDDVLKGGGGNDTLSGGGGSDILQGGAGLDVLTGGSGVDTFRFEGPGANPDRVADFETGVDKVGLSVSGFGIASVSDFDIRDAATGPTEARATLLVDLSNVNVSQHTISWDPDGTGAQAAVTLAQGAFTTAAGDYVVF